MKPWITIASTPPLTLKERDGEFLVLVSGKVLMTSKRHGSEDALADIGCEKLGGEANVLIGGLGVGFTLRRAIDICSHETVFHVVELSAALVEWNRTTVADVARRPLEDDRVTVEVADVAKVMGKRPGEFDAILLDVDNGPFALNGNEGLYGLSGLSKIYGALKPGGRAAIWSASDDPKFIKRLREMGFDARTVVTQRDGARHVVFIAERPAKRSQAQFEPERHERGAGRRSKSPRR